jgi:hypothetical protein
METGLQWTETLSSVLLNEALRKLKWPSKHETANRQSSMLS